MNCLFVRKIFILVSIVNMSSLFAGIIFSTQGSTVHVTEDAELHIGNNGAIFAGTLKHDDGGAVTGTPIVFNNGVVALEGKSSVFTGTYDGDNGPLFSLTGNSTLQAGLQFSVSNLSVSGSTNTLAGYPLLTSALTLGSNINLQLQLISELNKSIILAGGTAKLLAPLVCGIDVGIKGVGAIDLNGYRYALSGYYVSPLTGTISFHNAHNIELQGKLPFSADWTFTGTNNVIDGKGAILDLRNGGTLTIASGAKLLLRNMILKGVTNSNIIFSDTTSTLEFEEVQLDLLESVTTNEGKVLISGDTTIMTKGYDWTFSESGKLTIDGAILSLNVSVNSVEGYSGTIKVPNPIFVGHEKQSAHITSGVASGNFAYPNGGVILETAIANPEIVSWGTSGSLVLDKTTILSPDDSIAVSTSTVLDGRGSRLLFSRGTAPQIVVADDAELTLKNVELQGLVGTSISLGARSKLKIAENVVFNLAGDLSFDSELFELIGDTDIFEIESAGKRCVFELRSAPLSGSSPAEYTYQTHLALKTNSLRLNNVAFKGLNHVTSTTATIDGVSVSGSIVLGGGAYVDVDRLVTPLLFVVSGDDNRFNMLTDNVTFSGNVRYAATGTNVLELHFLLPDDFHGTPQVNFNAGAFTVASSYGYAYLVSDAPYVKFSLNAANGFSLGSNSLLAGNKIQVLGYPLQQASSRVSFRPGLQLTTTLSGGAVAPTVELLETMRALPLRSVVSSFELLEWERAQIFDFLTRAIELPNENVKPALHYDSAVALSPLSGNIILRESNGLRYSNLGASTTQAINFTLQDGVEVTQGDAATRFKPTDIINVVGGTLKYPNTIFLANNLTVAGKLLFDDDATLVLRAETEGTNPVITFESTAQLSFGARSTLVFSGRGTVVLPIAFIIDFAATLSRIIIEDGMQLLLSSGEQVTIRGKGSIQLDHGGQIVIDNGSAMRFGASYTDLLSLNVRTGSSVRVGNAYAGSNTPYSYLSFIMASNALNFSQGGTLAISDYGRCECNILKGISLPGDISQFNFSGGGVLYISKLGQLLFDDNLSIRDGIAVSFHGGEMRGNGLIGVLDSVLLGRVQNNIFSVTDQTAQSVVGSMIQTLDTLSSAIVFVNTSGGLSVRNRNGYLFSLNSNEVITTELSDGSVQGYQTLTGRRFTYDANGVRLA